MNDRSSIRLPSDSTLSEIAPVHKQPIGAVALDVNGRMAVGSYDGCVSIWERHNDTMICRSNRYVHAKGVNAVAFDPKGELVASGGSDGIAVIAHTGDSTRCVIVHHPVDVECLVFSPDGSRLFTGATNGEGRIWRCSDGKLLCNLHHGKTVGAATNFKGMLATGCNDRKIRLFRWEDGKPIVSCEVAEQPIKSLASCQGGLAFGSHDGLVRWVDDQLNYVGMIAEFPTTPKALASISISRLCIGAYDQTISIVDVRLGIAGIEAKVVKTWRHPSAWAHALATQGDLLAIGSFHAVPAVWRIKEDASESPTITPLCTGNAASIGISAVAIVSGGQLLVAGDEGEVLQVQFPSSHGGTPTIPRSIRAVCSVDAGVTDIKSLDDGFVVSTWDGRIERFSMDGQRVWRAKWASGELVGACPVLKIDIDPLSRRIIAGLYTGGAAFFCADSGGCLGEMPEATGAIKSVAVKGDIFAVTGRYDPIRVGCTSDQAIKSRLALGTPVSDFVAISPFSQPNESGRLAVVASNNEVWMVDVSRGALELDIVHKGGASRLPVKALAFVSPDTVLAGDYDGCIVLHRIGKSSRTVLQVDCRLGISALTLTEQGVVWASFDGTIGLVSFSQIQNISY